MNYDRIENDLKKKIRNKVIADNIRYFQEKRGIGTRELSKMTGISESGLRNYRNGIRLPDDERFNNIAKALKVTIRELKRKRDILGTETLTNLEHTLLEFNFNKTDIDTVISNLCEIYSKNDFKATEVNIEKPNISKAISLCKNIINKYLEANNITKNVLNFVIPLLDDLNIEYILSIYSVPVYNLNCTPLIIENKSKILNTAKRFIISRENLKNDSNYFGIFIDEQSISSTYSFEKGTTLILEEIAEITSNAIGLFQFSFNKTNYIDLFRVEYIDLKTDYYITRLVSVQDNINLLPYALKEKDIKEYDLKLLGVVKHIYLSNNSSSESLKFQ